MCCDRVTFVYVRSRCILGFSSLSKRIRTIAKYNCFFQVTCSYLQIYQERVYDLLGTEKSGTEVYLREHPKKGRENNIKNTISFPHYNVCGLRGMIFPVCSLLVI